MKLRVKLNKQNEDYVKILEMFLFEDCNAKIVNYEDSEQFECSDTIIECDCEPEIENQLSADSIEYDRL